MQNAIPIANYGDEEDTTKFQLNATSCDRCRLIWHFTEIGGWRDKGGQLQSDNIAGGQEGSVTIMGGINLQALKMTA